MVVFGGGGGGGGRYTIKLRKTFERSSLIVPKVWQLELVIPSFFCFFLFVCLNPKSRVNAEGRPSSMEYQKK